MFTVKNSLASTLETQPARYPHFQNGVRARQSRWKVCVSISWWYSLCLWVYGSHKAIQTAEMDIKPGNGHIFALHVQIIQRLRKRFSKLLVIRFTTSASCLSNNTIRPQYFARRNLLMIESYSLNVTFDILLSKFNSFVTQNDITISEIQHFWPDLVWRGRLRGGSVGRYGKSDNLYDVKQAIFSMMKWWMSKQGW